MLSLMTMMMLIRQTSELQNPQNHKKIIAKKKVEHSNANFYFIFVMGFCDSVGCIEWTIV